MDVKPANKAVSRASRAISRGSNRAQDSKANRGSKDSRVSKDSKVKGSRRKGDNRDSNPAVSNQGNSRVERPAIREPDPLAAMDRRRAGMNDAIRDLSQARQRLQASDQDASKEALRLLQQLQGLNMANANDKELADRIQREVLPELQRLELQLRRQLDDKDAGQVRTGGADQVPTGYADAVAEYFRKLSKGK